MRKMYKVTNTGHCYPSYGSFFRQQNLEQYLPYYQMGRSLSSHPTHARRFYLEAQGPHSFREDLIIAVIQEVNTKEVYLVSIDAIEEAS